VSKLEPKGTSITDQIPQGLKRTWNSVLSTEIVTDESKEQFRREELERIRNISEIKNECIDMLIRGELPVNAGNLMAAAGLHNIEGNPFRRFMDKMSGFMEEDEPVAQGEMTLDTDGNEIVTTMSEIEQIFDLLDREAGFAPIYEKLLNHMSEIVESSSLSQASSCVDVKELQLIHKQLHVMGKLAKQEEYHIPMYVGGELAAIHLTIRRGAGERGRVNVALDIPMGGSNSRVEGSFYLRDGKLSGYIAGNTEEAVTKVRKAADIFHINAAKEWTVGDLMFVSAIPREGNNIPWEGDDHGQDDRLSQEDDGFLGQDDRLPREEDGLLGQGDRLPREGDGLLGQGDRLSRESGENIRREGGFRPVSSAEELYRVAKYFLEAVKSL
jgi:hypothetical protein